ncbi:MAG: hypothetical protein FJY67_08455, partial [Calditrichaeota bacterium]|nr:hypothetical protein [Calditrichota bacterium]
MSVIEHGSTSLHLTFDLPQTPLPYDSNALSDLIIASRFQRWVAIPSRGSVRATVVSVNGRNADGLETDLMHAEQPLVKVGEPRLMRGVRLVPIGVAPVGIDPYGEGYIASRIEVSLEFTSQPGVFESIKPARDPGPLFGRVLASFVINPRSEWTARRDDVATSLGRMLILYPSALDDQLARNRITRDFANRKRRLGYEVETVAIDAGDLTPQEIKDQFVIPRYEQEGLDYLIIVGSDQLIAAIDRDERLFFPSFFEERYNGRIGQIEEDEVNLNRDLEFGTFDGEGDLFPEIIISRLMFPTAASLIGGIDRSLRYEVDPVAPRGPWQYRAAVISDHDDPGQQPLADDREFIFWMRNVLARNGYREFTTILGGRDGEAFNSFRTMLTEEGGASLVLDNGYLWGAVNEEDYNDVADTRDMDGNHLSNPFLVALMNHYGPPILYPFFARVEQNDPRGPVGALGLNTYNWDNHHIKPFLKGTVKAIDSNMWTPAEFYLSALLEQASERAWAEQTGYDTVVAFDYATRLIRLLGDPTISIYSAAPGQFATSLPENLQPGARSVSFVVRNSTTNQPVSGAVVVISQPDAIQLVAMTDGDGAVRFTIPDGLVEDNLAISLNKHNYKTYVTNWQVEASPVSLEMVEYAVDGEGDGIVVNGESVDFTLTLVNNGRDDASNIVAEFSSDSPFLSFSRDRARIDDINSGESGGLADEVDLTLSAECPGGTRIRVQIDLLIGENIRQEAAFEFTTAGPRPVLEGELALDNIAPGQNGTILPTIVNRGNRATGALATQLVSLSPDVRVLVGARNIASLDPDRAGRPDAPYAIAIDSYFVPGSTARLELRIESGDGFRIALPIEISIGEPAERDPVGPDAYGYLCFDSGDERWPERPLFRWREINADVEPFEARGQRLDITDLRGQAGASTLIDLPFPVRYYGEEFDQLVVSTNGWASFDPASIDFTSHNASEIPGGAAPFAQLCPLWQNIAIDFDDFGRFGVFAYEFANEGLFVIEWSDVQLYQGAGDQLITAQVDFQILLHNSELYPTPTGDSEIIYQYRRFQSMAGPDTRSRFAVVGIRSPDNRDGIQYARWNRYAPGAAPITENFALKFTTGVRMPRGDVRGRVVLASNIQQGVPDVIVFHPRGIETITDANGNYSLNDLRPGDYENVSYRRDGFARSFLSFQVVSGEITNVPLVRMGQPAIQATDRIERSLRPDGSLTDADITVHNSGNGPLEISDARVVYPDGSLPALGLMHQFPVTGAAGDSVASGIVYIDSLFYVSQRSQNRFVINVYNREGAYLDEESFDQPNLGGESEFGLQNLTWSGRYIFGTVYLNDGRSRVVAFDREGNLGGGFGFDSPIELTVNLPIAFSPDD